MVRVSSHAKDSQVQLKQLAPAKSPYGSYTAIEGAPASGLSRPTQGISIQRGFDQNDEVV